MRILLDEHLNWRLARYFSEAYEVRSVRGMGWAGIQNGELLALAVKEFDVMVTMDQGIEHQQNLAERRLVVILLQGKSNRLEDTIGFVEQIERLLRTPVSPGRLYRLASSE